MYPHGEHVSRTAVFREPRRKRETRPICLVALPFTVMGWGLEVGLGIRVGGWE